MLHVRVRTHLETTHGPYVYTRATYRELMHSLKETGPGVVCVSACLHVIVRCALVLHRAVVTSPYSPGREGLWRWRVCACVRVRVEATRPAWLISGATVAGVQTRHHLELIFTAT